MRPCKSRIASTRQHILRASRVTVPRFFDNDCSLTHSSRLGVFNTECRTRRAATSSPARRPQRRPEATPRWPARTANLAPTLPSRMSRLLLSNPTYLPSTAQSRLDRKRRNPSSPDGLRELHLFETGPQQPIDAGSYPTVPYIGTEGNTPQQDLKLERTGCRTGCRRP